MKNDVREILTAVLNNKLNNLEHLRSKLHNFCVQNSLGTFPRDVHSDPAEALRGLIKWINLPHLHQESFIDIKLQYTCDSCGDIYYQSKENPWGNPNILYLGLSKASIQEEVNEYLNFTSTKTRQFCTKCKEMKPTQIDETINTNDILILAIVRFKHNGHKIYDEIWPNQEIVVKSKRYQLRSLLCHHGDDSKNGHYKCSILNKVWYLLNDFSYRKKSDEDIGQSYMLFYERIETANDNENVSNSNIHPNEHINVEETDEQSDVQMDSGKESENYLEDGVVTIDAPVDKKKREKARIVDKNGTLKIQCLNCMKTVPNIITHSLTKECKDTFLNYDGLEELLARMKKLQKARWNKKDWEKNKAARNQSARANYAADPKQKKEAAKKSYEANPIPKKDAAKKSYEANPIPKKDAAKKSYEANPIPKKEAAKKASKKSYEANPKPKLEASSFSYAKDPKAKQIKFKENYEQRKKLLGEDEEKVIKNFFKKQSEGTLFACICCHRMLFKSSMVPFHKEDPKDEIVKAINFFNLHNCITTDDSMKYDEQFWLCFNCKKNLKEGKMPNMCWANGLDVSPLPDHLSDLTDLEHLMIKKNLVFIKLKPKLSTGMQVMHGNVCNVPISNNDLLRTCAFLPRKEDDLATVNVAFKRMRKAPYYHRYEARFKKHDVIALNTSCFLESKLMYCY